MKIRVSLLLVLLSATSNKAWAQTNYVPQVGKWSPHAWVWTTEEWTGDEKPYQRIRLYIDKFIAQGQKPDNLARKYKVLAQKDTSDPQAQFRWGYAAFRAAAKSATPELHLQGVENAFEWTNSPRTAEFARVWFLVIARNSPYHRLSSVGERLVRRFPKEDELKFYVIKVLDPGLVASERPKSLKLARELVQSQPKRPSAYSVLGETYFKIWTKSKNPADANKAIAAYRKVIQIAPPNHPSCKEAQGWIKFIQRLTLKR